MRGILIRYDQRTTCGSCEKKTLKQAFFFQMREKWQIVTFQTPIVCNCMKKKLCCYQLRICFQRFGSSLFLESPHNIEDAHCYTDCIRCQGMFVYSSPFNSGCMFALSKLCQKEIDKHALMVESRKICFFLLSHYLCSNKGLSHVEYYHWPRNFPFR